MIDYEKLKLAHVMAAKLSLTVPFVQIRQCFKNGTMEFSLDLHDGLLHWKMIDGLLMRLEELTKPESKYKQGDELYHVHMNMPCSFKCTVSRWDDNVKQYVYGYHGEWSLMESEIFPTRQALIEHQLEYWSKLMQEECKHLNKYYQEGDGTYDCDDCGVIGIKPDTQRNQSQVNVDRYYIGSKCKQHESDGDIYTSFPPKYKCVKCGEFY